MLVGCWRHSLLHYSSCTFVLIHYYLHSMRYLYTSLRRWGLSLLTCSLLAGSLSAQTDNEVQLDRPDQSEGTSVLSPRRLQIEWGVGTSSGYHNMGLMLRYGLVPDLELRLEALLLRPYRGAVQVSDLTLSSKLALFSGDGWIPAMTLVGYLNYAPQEEARRVTGDLTLALEQELVSGLSLTCNIGSAEGMRRLSLTAELGYNFTDRLSSFVEYYGVFGPAEQGCDLGLSYVVTKDFLIDLSCGRTFFASGAVNYASLGATYRL